MKKVKVELETFEQLLVCLDHYGKLMNEVKMESVKNKVSYLHGRNAMALADLLRRKHGTFR